MRKLLLAATAVTALAFGPAHAAQIISFGQVSGSNTVTATDDGTTTTISVNGAAVLIDQIFGITTPPAIDAFMDFTAVSQGAAIPVGSQLVQHFNGSFTICSTLNCAGPGNVNDLSGIFTDAAFGSATGAQLSVNVSSPPDTILLTSDVISAADLTTPGSFTLSMSNIAAPPGLHLDGTTIAAFTASFSGVASATPVVETPEPMSIALLGFGLLGTAALGRRQRR